MHLKHMQRVCPPNVLRATALTREHLAERRRRGVAGASTNGRSYALRVWLPKETPIAGCLARGVSWGIRFVR